MDGVVIREYTKTLKYKDFYIALMCSKTSACNDIKIEQYVEYIPEDLDRYGVKLTKKEMLKHNLNEFLKIEVDIVKYFLKKELGW